MNKPYFIAEVGVNFYDTAKVENISPLEAAKRYIKEAKKAGANFKHIRQIRLFQKIRRHIGI